MSAVQYTSPSGTGTPAVPEEALVSPFAKEMSTLQASPPLQQLHPLQHGALLDGPETVGSFFMQHTFTNDVLSHAHTPRTLASKNVGLGMDPQLTLGLVAQRLAESIDDALWVIGLTQHLQR